MAANESGGEALDQTEGDISVAAGLAGALKVIGFALETALGNVETADERTIAAAFGVER